MYQSEGRSITKAEDLNFNGLGLKDSEGEDEELDEYEEKLV